MPLQTTNSLPYIAIHDFPSYKVMQKVDDYYLVCPPNDEWNKTRYELGRLYRTSSDSMKDYDVTNTDLIGPGFFHTFLDLKDAEEYRKIMSSSHPHRNFIILNVTIPRNAIYYVGRYSRYTSMFTYASNKIIYESEL